MTLKEKRKEKASGKYRGYITYFSIKMKEKYIKFNTFRGDLFIESVLDI